MPAEHQVVGGRRPLDVAARVATFRECRRTKATASGHAYRAGGGRSRRCVVPARAARIPCLVAPELVASARIPPASTVIFAAANESRSSCSPTTSSTAGSRGPGAVTAATAPGRPRGTLSVGTGALIGLRDRVTPVPIPMLARRGGGPQRELALAHVDQVFELDAADRTCPSCGGGLEPMPGQFETSEMVLWRSVAEAFTGLIVPAA